MNEAVLALAERVMFHLDDIAAPLIFLLASSVVMRFLPRLIRRSLRKKYREPVIADFITTVVSGLIWFGIGLLTVSMFGFEDIAASLGTATGFIALGVSFALKDMIADVVSGVRLLKDEDFNPGDQIKAAGTEGKVVEIDLRKTRIDLENGDRSVLANRDVEKSWTKIT